MVASVSREHAADDAELRLDAGDDVLDLVGRDRAGFVRDDHASKERVHFGPGDARQQRELALERRGELAPFLGFEGAQLEVCPAVSQPSASWTRADHGTADDRGETTYLVEEPHGLRASLRAGLRSAHPGVGRHEEFMCQPMVWPRP